ncbi:MAG: adenosylcobinamide-GDP ribazoletransferase [Firmicutes bacterium]|nr:adenosylcobinamide-GDP ribazoletransferase [Bacillota bacterium]
MKSFLMMLTFLTRIPIKINFEYEKKDFLKGIYFIPFIGLIIGVLFFLLSKLEMFLDKPILAIIIWIFYIWITGGLHIDGLADTIDGIFSNRKKERILEIMRDSKIGAFGVISIMLLLSLNVLLTYYINLKYLLLVPIIGRSSMLIACSISNYARKGPGMGKDIIENCGFKKLILGVIFPILLVLILNYNYDLILLMLLTNIFVLLITKHIKGIIDGITGDTIGFIIEISQTIFMFSLYINSLI